jgi:hypothetical protein
MTMQVRLSAGSGASASLMEAEGGAGRKGKKAKREKKPQKPGKGFG